MTWGIAVALMIATAMPAAAQALSRAELLAALRAGGYVIYFRHADTDHSRQDQRTGNLEDCATQRPLSDKGRANSRAIGEAIRALLSTAPPTGKNTAIIGHGHPYYVLIGKGQMLEEGEAAVVRPHGANFQEVARLGLKEWRELGELSR